MELEDEEMGGDPACWAHLFEDADENEGIAPAEAAPEGRCADGDALGTAPSDGEAGAGQPRSSLR